MTATATPPPAGHYARKQIGCGSWWIRWAHQRRFQTGLALARQVAGRRVLDYGCGDGTLLEYLMTAPDRPAMAVGVERTTELAELCRARLAHVPGLRFATVADLATGAHDAAYDAVICTEVLEHVTELDQVLDTLRRLARPGGRLIISVPVETGLPLLVKQAGRRVAGWRGIGDYPGTSPYGPAELARAVLTVGRAAERPIHRNEDGSVFHDHKGFDWRVVRAALAARFDLLSVVGSPFAWLPPALGMQVWFTAIARRA